MKVAGEHYRTIWLKSDSPEVVQIIDQRVLPQELKIVDLQTVDEVAFAIKNMQVHSILSLYPEKGS